VVSKLKFDPGYPLYFSLDKEEVPKALQSCRGIDPDLDKMINSEVVKINSLKDPGPQTGGGAAQTPLKGGNAVPQ
jgi:hypothetical protein